MNEVLDKENVQVSSPEGSRKRRVSGTKGAKVGKNSNGVDKHSINGNGSRKGKELDHDLDDEDKFEEDELSDEDVDISPSPKKVKSGRKRDLASDSEDEDVSIEPKLKKPANEKRVTNLSSAPDSVGSIKRIELVNFMCHKWLEVDLKPDINFIIGHNGSGKSAILTALTVCLGGKATFTNRGNALKALIKEGESAAQVTVTMTNTGFDSYRHETYGDEIIVERKLLREGTGSYKIMSKAGKVISRKREELTRICEAFQIQVDNPLAILTQDTARSFLASSSSKDKYNFFMRGTLLSDLKDQYDELEGKLDIMRENIQRSKIKIPELENQELLLRRKLEELKVTDDLALKKIELQNQLAWCHVEESENELKQKNGTMNAANEKKSKIEQKLVESNNKINAAAADFEVLQNLVRDQQTNTNPIQEQIQNLRQRQKNCVDRSNQVETQRRQLQGDWNNAQSNLKKLEALIVAETRKLAAGTQENMARRNSQIKDREDKCQSITQEMNTVKEEQVRLENEMNQSSGERNQLRDNLRIIERNIREARTSISELQMRQQNKLTAFGRNMPRVVAKINEYSKRGRWTGSEPIGPIGMYVTVRDVEYQRIIEFLIGSTLNAIIVDNQEDLKTLQALARECGEPGLVIFKAGRPIQSIQEPSNELLTVNRLIEVSNRKVWEQIIIQTRAEALVLVPDQRTGDKLTENGFPANVKGVYTKDLYQCGNRHGGLSSQALYVPNSSTKLIADVTGAIREHEETIQRISEEQQTLQQRIQTANTNFQQFENQLKLSRRRTITLQNQLGQFQNEIKEIQQEIQDSAPGNIAVLEEKKQEAKTSMDLITNQFPALDEQLAQINREIAEIRAEIQTHQTNLRNTTQQSEKLQSDITTLKTYQQSLRIEKDHWTVKLEECEEEIRLATIFYEEMKERVAENIEMANQICERVQVIKSRRALEKDIQSIQVRLDVMEKQFGTKEEVIEELEAKQNELYNVKSSIEAQEQARDALHKTLDTRRNRWDTFRSFISARSKMLFSMLIAKRLSRGKLKINHDAKTLDLIIYTNANDGERERDSRSLSGGEKSYSQVCFLISLWDTMGGPFRALDEWDIFCDSVNRKKIMQLFLDQANDDVNARQYILITPQDL
ncbi:Structural maintenance of chromosomes protein 6, partial [Nowakowskiella sp. JEL0407]